MGKSAADPKRADGTKGPATVALVHQVLDVAGVPVRLAASDEHDWAVLTAAVGGFGKSSLEASAELTARTGDLAVPPGPPDDEREGTRLWRRPDGLVVIGPTAIAVSVTGRRAELVLPPGVGAGERVEGLVSQALSWLLAAHRRFLLHAAVVARGDDAVLALGHSGAGKSSLVVAAAAAGLEALTDDAAIVEPVAGGFRAHGVHQPVHAPRELGGDLVGGGGPTLGDVRDRVRIGSDLLTRGGRRVVGVVLLGHSDQAEGELAKLPGHAAMPLLAQSFVGIIHPPHRAAYLPVAAGLARLGVWRLGHGADPTRRLAASGALLLRCFERA
jgi:hypothetical protein